MIIVDKKLQELERSGDTIKVAMVGAGFFARGVALQFQTAARAMKLVAIANRTVENAFKIYSESGTADVDEVSTLTDLDSRIEQGKASVTADAQLLCNSEKIDVIIEATGDVPYGAEVVLAAIQNRKHVIVNAELDATIGPILKVYADQHGVVFTDIDGDQPGVLMNLYRFLKGIGVQPVLCGNIKGLHDPYRNPTTQQSFAKEWGQNPTMVTSFADGSKISFEQAVVANATEMKVGTRGMVGPTVPAGTPIEDAIKQYPDELLQTSSGVVDYIVGASPGPGVFIIGRHDHPIQQQYLKLFKMGEGPLYCFTAPFHLCHFEVPNTVARAVLFDDATITPAGPPMVQVVAVAKKSLQAGEKLDGNGGYTVYGVCENTEIVEEQQLLPLGITKGARVLRDIPKDSVISRNDVFLEENRLVDTLIAEQQAYFSKQLSF